ncbi:hypothetical protein KDW_23840 [Dictyobacter vulcani]|uniref:Uncharacterized protein n=1 Tax=Dictyobacter vulcani TaxID=2607529 RepID=A0A5J4KM60_9CHLR|nr:hypothetical protein [Dictyobacter vulcani]GER88222.1 hypothetical protein KDW_23840 [Dictyobacter vulcani]
MRKNDPMRRYYLLFFIMEGLIVLGLLFQVITSLAIGRPNYFLIGETIFLGLLLLLVFFVFKRRHQRTERRRQQALSGDAALMAQPQPEPDAHALMLPAKIALHLDIKRLFLFLTACALLFTLIATLLMLLIVIHTNNIRIIAILFGIMFAIYFFSFLIAFILCAVVMRRFLEQEIIVQEDGIATKIYSKSTFIPWQEVQSFAMWGNAKWFSAIQFEITSEKGVARWIQLGPKKKFLTRLSMLKPETSFDEYHNLTARVQQVIVAHTGKPLYDLRDEKIVWW